MTHPLSSAAAGPRPSVADIQRLLATELTAGQRVVHVLLLLADLLVGIAVASLWLTEPVLPARTQVAFAAIVGVSLAWAAYFVWTLSRRRVLFARHRLVAARLAVGVSSTYLMGALLLAATAPAQRPAALAAAAMGAVLCAGAGIFLLRARRRLAALMTRAGVQPGRGGSVTTAMLAVALLVPATAGRAQSPAPAAIDVDVLAPPAVVTALGRAHIVYELQLTNFGRTPRRISSIAAIDPDAGRTLAAWTGRPLAAATTAVGASGPAADPLRLEPGASAVVYAWISLDPGQPAPRHLRHRVETDGAPGEAADTTECPTVDVRPAPAAAAAPVGAGTWVAVRGPSNGSAHRRSLVSLDGRTRVPQRFAVDWAKLGEDGRLFRGDGRSNEQWYGFGAAVRASRGGKVVRVVTGVPDHPPLVPPDAEAFTRETLTGNTVVVDEGDGRFAVYAHLRDGSVAVAEGTTVTSGSRLGDIGNSGHSLAPHLHFHVDDRPDPLASEGLPFALDAFRLVGRVDDVGALLRGGAWTTDPRRPARDVTAEIPLENMVVTIER